MCLLSHLTTLYLEIKNHPPRVAAGALLPSSLTGVLGDVCDLHLAGSVLSDPAGPDGGHLWNTEAGGMVCKNHLLQSVLPARTRLFSARNTGKDHNRRGILWLYRAK